MGVRTKGRTCLKISLQVIFSFLEKHFWSPWKREMSVHSFCLIFLSLQMESSAGERRGWSWHCQNFISVSGCTLGDWQVIGNGAQPLRWMIRSDSHIFHTENDLCQQFPYAKYRLAFCIKKKKSEAEYAIINWYVYFLGMFSPVIWQIIQWTALKNSQISAGCMHLNFF